MIHFEQPQALKIVLEVQLKRSNEKIAKKKNFNLQNMFIFIFFVFGPLLLSKFLTFSFLVHLKRCKVVNRNGTISSTNYP